MMEKQVKYGVRFIHLAAGLLRPGMAMLFLLPFLLGCPYNNSYHVYYDGNQETEGYPPVDSKAYFPGDPATVLAKPDGLKKGALEFLGWRRSRSGNESPLQAGDRIEIAYEDVWLYAWWEDDPNYNPYIYADHPDTGGVIITQYHPYNEPIYSEITTTIPDTLDGKPVTVIGEGAFANRYFEKIVLPSKLQIIENKAFAGGYITDIAIPNTVESIGKLAFQRVGLQSITWGSGIESIGDYAFDGNYLTTLFLPAAVKSLGEGAFSDNEVVAIEIGENVDIKNKTSLGKNGASFLEYYRDKNRSAGFYVYKNNAWQGPYNTR
ncbi:MAG: leucine-rich repeat domain-containing protein [Treponema sp.]|jgi:hypothetical protein|nr:leucine-rich repeat domain-containing protein [Treponema sp.]